MKRCPYCLHFHERRSRACSEWCEHRVGGRAAYVTRSRREVVGKVMAGIQRRMRFVPTWRRVSMGEEPDLLTIFGTEPHDGPPRHGETLDAA